MCGGREERTILIMLDTPKIAEYATAISVGLVGLVFGLQKVLTGWRETSAESSVIKMMHDELERLSAQNKILTTELNSLQTTIISLHQELRNLTVENQKLHSEVTSLTQEVTRLQATLNKQTQ